MAAQDTVTSVNIPRNPADMPQMYNRNDIETIVDQRIGEHLHQISRARNEAKKEIFKQRAVISGVGAVIGLGAGIGGTLLIQKLRRRSGGMK